MINLELTDRCNIKCRHCYNFWRNEDVEKKSVFTFQTFDRFLEMVLEAEVFHVVLTGGEPFLNFEVLEYALKRLTENGVSHSVNSNLMLASEDKIARLRDAGLDHILTSLNSFNPQTNDFMAQQEGAYEKILRGITIARSMEIRVSLNMIVSQTNKEDVYGTGSLASQLGCQRIFATRTVPSVSLAKPESSDTSMEIQDIKKVLNDLIRVQDDFKIGVGTLVSYPLCLLGDLAKYSALVGRGCPAQSGNRMSVNPDGQAHACVHEESGYGNIYEEGIKKVFKKMQKWHDGSYFFKDCGNCDYLSVCRSGCRMSAYACNAGLASRDPLMPEGGANNITEKYQLKINEKILKVVEEQEGKSFIVPKRIRFREEDGFYLLNVRWANAFPIDNDVGQFLIEKQKHDKPFTIAEFGSEKKQTLIYLILKDAVELETGGSLVDQESRIAGASIDPFTLMENKEISYEVHC